MPAAKPLAPTNPICSVALQLLPFTQLNVSLWIALYITHVAIMPYINTSHMWPSCHTSIHHTCGHHAIHQYVTHAAIMGKAVFLICDSISSYVWLRRPLAQRWT